MSRTATVGLLCFGTFLTGVSRVKHPTLEPFSDAMAYVGGAILAIANTNGLFPRDAVTKTNDPASRQSH